MTAAEHPADIRRDSRSDRRARFIRHGLFGGRMGFYNAGKIIFIETSDKEFLYDNK